MGQMRQNVTTQPKFGQAKSFSRPHLARAGILVASSGAIRLRVLVPLPTSSSYHPSALSPLSDGSSDSTLDGPTMPTCTHV